MKTLWRYGLERFAPGGEEGRLAVLLYHRVLERPDPLRPDEPDLARFTWQMETLARLCNVLPLGEAVQRLRSGTLPPRAVAVTFDDGYADNLTVALPVLQRFGLPATVFVASGFLDGGIMWNDLVLEAFARARPGRVDLSPLGLGEVEVADVAVRRNTAQRVLRTLKYLPMTTRLEKARALAEHLGAELPGDLMLTTEQLRTLAQAGIEIGAHTAHHPILAVLEENAARTEIVEGREALEERLERPVTLFAYPNGRPGQDYTPAHVRMVREMDFQAAFTTHWAVNAKDSDPFQLARVHVWDRTPVRFTLRLAHAFRRGPEGVPKATGSDRS